MLWLPRLILGEQPCRLPLSAPTAVGLAGALCETSPRRRRVLLCRLLDGDAALVLWALCRAESAGCEFRAVRPLADWLSPRLPTLLDAGRSRLPSGTSTSGDAPSAEISSAELSSAKVPSGSRDPRARLAKLAGDAAAAAEVAVALAGKRPSVDPRDVHLPALLHQADQWLGVPLPPPARELGKYLPQWLRRALAEARLSTPGEDTPAGCVADAIRYVHEDPPSADSTAASKHVDAKAVQRRSRKAARRWSASLDSVSPDLEELAGRLLRLDRLEREFADELEREKLAALRQLAYGASHEINNPLANIATRAQSLLRDETNPDRRRILAAINRQAFRATDMIADLMLFANPPRPELQSVDLGEMIAEVIAELAPLAAEQHTTLEAIPPDSPLMIVADRTQLMVALKALCANSLEALGSGGRIEVALRRRRKPDKPTQEDTEEEIQIVVHDNGPGIDPQVRHHLFDPFYSGREAGRGLGFGLSKCWRIVTGHGGRIVVDSPHGRGATITIALRDEA